MRIKNRDQGLEFLKNWEKRCKDKKLEQDVRTQWERGNKGQYNDWRIT